MGWEIKYPKDENKNYRYDWENLKVGDYVFTDSNSGFCSGGLTYDVGVLVIEITDEEITTEDSSGQKEKWCKIAKTPKQPPWAYYLGAFQSNATNF